ncbi:MAG TPA: VanZ family protein [Candidatus Limnocylindria bacterium]
MRFDWSWIDGGRETAIALLLLVVGAGFVVLAVRLMRGSAQQDGDAMMRNLALAAAVAIIVIATLVPTSGRNEPSDLNLVPFSNVLRALAGRESLRFAIVELAANIVLFVPLGMALRWRFPSLGVMRIALGALAISLVVEVLQGVTGFGRSVSTTDLITNTLGGVVGALAAAGDD